MCVCVRLKLAERKQGRAGGKARVRQQLHGSHRHRGSGDSGLFGFNSGFQACVTSWKALSTELLPSLCVHVLTLESGGAG